MFRKRLGLMTGLCAISTAAAAGTITVDTGDIALKGGMTAGYFYSDNTGSSNTDNFHVSDMLIELSDEAKTGGVGFKAGFGSMSAITILDGGVNNSAGFSTFGLQYGSVDFAPIEGLTISAGKLATNIGYEVTPSYANAHATIAALWGGQPVYYPGIRASYSLGDVSVYAETNNDTLKLGNSTATNAYAVGVSGSAGSLNYMASYYDYDKAKNIVDVIVSTTVGNIDLAINADYHMLDSEAKVAGQDDSAMGVALYIKPTYGKMSYPVRIEYMSDGTSGIYGFDSATTYTITPTYSPSANTFVRAEVSMVQSTNKVFADKDGVATDSKTNVALQAGYRF
ncbi:MAG: porin [Gammaproteobacteria bacterium]|nr:porin [Gammaproteobacteria bacterium]